MAHVCDFLIIGSGAAGLSFALRAAEKGTVLVLTKKERADSNTNYAQGGIAAVFSPEDSFEDHVKDTLEAGVGLCRRDAVEQIVREGPDRIWDLYRWGVPFTLKGDNKTFDLGREGGHTKHRIVHVLDKTGMAVEAALLERVRNHPNIKVLEKQVAIDLITEHHLFKTGKTDRNKIHCWGVYALNGETHEVDIYLAKCTLLASGGAGSVYLHTTNPSIATGDGIAMAYRAGAFISNMEFMQFHPTTLFHPEGNSFLISEAVRGFGAVLRNKDGEAFMKNYHPMMDLAPRDIVARSIDREMKIRGEQCVYLDATKLDADAVRSKFPQIYQRLLTHKIDMTRELIPVVPAAHYTCGGVATDLEGRSSIDGLYVTGEAACTGVHGANRLASNSLLEALVFSHHAYKSAVRYFSEKQIQLPTVPPWDDSGTYDQEEWVLISHDQREIQRLMWDYVGIVRSDERLYRASRRVNLIAEEIESFYKKRKVTPALLELRNIACLAALMIRSAMFRKESRGLHYNTDYPDKDDARWLGDTAIRSQSIALEKVGFMN